MKSDIPAVRCENLSRYFGEIKALESLNLSIQQGAIFGFLGRNGAGKTTTIRLLTGLARPTKGRAWIHGEVVTDGSLISRWLFGYLPEEPAFYSWMTPIEYLTYIGSIFEMEPKQLKSRVGELLEVAGLNDAARRKIGGFSRGMRQRLGLAQALLHSPRVLFLDEPTSALDPAGRREVLDLIGTMRANTTVFLSSHILDDVERVCDTIGVIHQGDLLLVSARDELMARYVSQVVRLKLGGTSGEKLDRLAASLASAQWVRKISRENQTVRVFVSDQMEAKDRLPRMVLDHGLILEEYVWEHPSLEDIFLELSSSEPQLT